MENEMVTVCIYCDSTGLFSEEECNSDNLTDMDFPRWVVEEWYKANKKDLDIETSHDLGIPLEEATFEKWLDEVSWAGDTDGLYQFAVDHGAKPTFGLGQMCTVFYRDQYNYKYSVFCGNYDECREFMRENDFKWEYNDDYYNEYKVYDLEVM